MGHIKTLLVIIFCFSISYAYNSLNITANWSLNFYKKIISPLQGQNICNFSPTCSQFYKQSINKHGIVIGSMMGADRLMRCNPWAWAFLDKYYFGVDNNRLLDLPENHYVSQVMSLRPDSGKQSHITNEGDYHVHFAWTRNDTLAKPTTNNQQPTTTLAFADYLFQSQDYTRAIGEYKRLLFFYPDTQDNIKEYIQLMLGESYLMVKDCQQALSYFSLQDNPYFNYNRARVYFEQGDYPKTRDELNSVLDMGFDEKQIVLYGMSFYKEHNFSDGARFFQTHAPAGFSVINELCNFDGKEIKKRNRTTSTLFSVVIPGLGQVYSSRFGDGLYSFLTVVGCGSLAYYYWEHDNSKVKFSIFSLLTALFWSGNVYGANIAARDYNEFQIKQYLMKIDNVVRELDLTPNYDKLKMKN